VKLIVGDCSLAREVFDLQGGDQYTVDYDFKFTVPNYWKGAKIISFHKNSEDSWVWESDNGQSWIVYGRFLEKYDDHVISFSSRLLPYNIPRKNIKDFM
jgi:hypothetical protein